MTRARRSRVRRKPGEWWKKGSTVDYNKPTTKSSATLHSGEPKLVRSKKAATSSISSLLVAKKIMIPSEPGSARRGSESDDGYHTLQNGLDYGPEVDGNIQPKFISNDCDERRGLTGTSPRTYHPVSLQKESSFSSEVQTSTRRKPNEMSMTVSKKMKRNRGRGNHTIQFNRLNRNSLRSRADLILSANSASTKSNVKRARILLHQFATAHEAPDPEKVTPDSSTLVMNLIADYCNYGKSNSLKNDAMGCLIQGLRIVYEEHGHTTAWSIADGRAFGNPLIENRDIKKLRQAHRVHLSKQGVISVKARPLTASIVCEHAAKYWHNGNDEDILLHAIFVVGLNLGLRYDEVGKLSINFVSVTSDSVTLRTDCGVKNQTSQRSYRLEDWPGNTELYGSIFMDPTIALLSWLSVRGPYEGYLFCDTVKNNHGVCKIDTARPLSSERFNRLMRNRLLGIGIAPGDVLMYSGHSLKRGSVQLFRSLGLRDEYVMQRVQMVGHRAYANYCEAYNDCAPEDLPRFSSEKEYLQHAIRLMEEKKVKRNDNAFFKFMREVVGSEVQ